ncbi:MAG: SdpI family protein [Candidatus Dadabacteria bacterium]
MKNKFLSHTIMLIIALFPLAYFLIQWNNIPATVPLHYNDHMQPDKIGTRSDMIIPVSILAVVSILVYLLLRNLQIFDPKRRTAPPSAVFIKFAYAVVFFLSLFNFIIVLSAIRGSNIIETFIFPAMGLMFAILGNYMYNLKPNFFAGFRLPWTLSDDDNWRRTHHLASKLWFAGGLLLVILGLLLPGQNMFPFFIGIMIVITLIPTIYSFTIFRSKANSRNHT